MNNDHDRFALTQEVAILRVIMGLQTPDESSLHFTGQRLEQDSLLELRQRMGLAIVVPLLFEWV
jgi:ABC-type proline/glycine betaine transport system ATPase subunit